MNIFTNSPAWLGETDPSRREAFERAMNVSNVGSVLMQTFINRVVQQLTVREFGVQATLDRKPGSGNAAYINRRTPGAAGGAWVADTDSLTEETGSYAQVSFTYKTLATRGKITRKAQATGRSYGDILAGEIGSKVEDFANALESKLINGDTASDAKEVDGLLTLIGGVSGQTVANTTAAAGDDLTLAKLDAAIDAVKGSASRSDLMIVGSFAGLRKLNAALQAQQQFNDMVEIAAGFRVRTYDGIPMVVSTAVNDDMAWSGSALTAFSGESSNPTTALVVLNKRHAWLEELTALTVMPLAKTSSQFDEFDMFWDGVLTYANSQGGAILGGLTA